MTWNDINFDDKTITVSKSLQRIHGKNVITPTKTYEARTLMVPDLTIKQLLIYKDKCYKVEECDPVFLWSKNFIENGMKTGSNLANVKRIHVHGLRYSHASYLINENVNIVLISKRLGHKDTSMTLDTYSHFFPTNEKDFISKINSEIQNTPIE